MSQAARTDPAFEAGRPRFLDLLAAEDRRPFDCSDVLVLVAHPDDETLALGGQFPRLRGVTVLHVTDGAPENMQDARALGFAARGDYAAARRKELQDALATGGVPAKSLLTLGVPDQGAAYRLPFLTLRLAALIVEKGISTLVTHAYEGGHPDHDATAFVAHAARCLILRQRGWAPVIVEFPLYHAGGGGMIVQRFPKGPANPEEVVLKLDAETSALKRRMLAAFKTQKRMLASFDSDVERLRPAPDYDFGALPNGGDVLYEMRDWGLKGRDWLRLAQEACREFGLPRWL